MGGSGSSLRRSPHGEPDASSPVETLNTLADPRVDRTKLHNLTDILVLSVLAVICGTAIPQTTLCGTPGPEPCGWHRPSPACVLKLHPGINVLFWCREWLWDNSA